MLSLQFNDILHLLPNCYDYWQHFVADINREGLQKYIITAKHSCKNKIHSNVISIKKKHTRINITVHGDVFLK